MSRGFQVKPFLLATALLAFLLRLLRGLFRRFFLRWLARGFLLSRLSGFPGCFFLGGLFGCLLLWGRLAATASAAYGCRLGSGRRRSRHRWRLMHLRFRKPRFFSLFFFFFECF